jgi:hypothetical protein
LRLQRGAAASRLLHLACFDVRCCTNLKQVAQDVGWDRPRHCGTRATHGIFPTQKQPNCYACSYLWSTSVYTRPPGTRIQSPTRSSSCSSQVRKSGRPSLLWGGWEACGKHVEIVERCQILQGMWVADMFGSIFGLSACLPPLLPLVRSGPFLLLFTTSTPPSPPML